MDTIGFCALFFAEIIEEVEEAAAPEVLSTMGYPRLAIIVCATLPMSVPSLINSSLFYCKKALRSSVCVPGKFGARGIGSELAIVMEMFHFYQVATIILMIFLFIFGVKKLSSYARFTLLNLPYGNPLYNTV
ncbi:hypothetical protein [Sodalis-like endosymbiont of Proechinophthirus fluctus]|uniref:hypothetical protein n=1 Tax=Sodalis-like endosymbiont of Proechinophthirus fluctus TaxID=1462730 RepID=UPI001FCACCED|nr:hypothetical protein [Sodalis-like endosymbiont of Proechinophthirus fluctus]